MFRKKQLSMIKLYQWQTISCHNIIIKSICMQKILLLLVLLTVIYADLAPKKHSKEYLAWKAKHGMNFDEKEDRYRMFLFQEKTNEIKAHNKNTRHTYKKDHNQFSCLTEEEFEKTYLGAVPPQDGNQVDSDTSSADSGSADTDSASIQSNDDSDSMSSESVTGEKAGHPNVKTFTPIDWHADGLVTGVRSQGRCGSCWAFAAVAHIEAKLLIKTEIVADLSEQQLTDCTYTRSGCRGGWMSTVYRYIAGSNRGITTESAYGYTASYSGSCQQSGGDFKIKSHTAVARRSCPGLMAALNDSPVSVALCASNWSGYQNGTFSSCGTSVNHGVLLVGYQANGDWKIKNSWGTGWGIDGYMILPAGNSCNICKWSTDVINF